MRPRLLRRSVASTRRALDAAAMRSALTGARRFDGDEHARSGRQAIPNGRQTRHHVAGRHLRRRWVRCAVLEARLVFAITAGGRERHFGGVATDGRSRERLTIAAAHGREHHGRGRASREHEQARHQTEQERQTAPAAACAREPPRPCGPGGVRSCAPARRHRFGRECSPAPGSLNGQYRRSIPEAARRPSESELLTTVSYIDTIGACRPWS
jgi:hypothetical protein